MTVKMPKNIQEERLRWILPIVNKEISIVDTVRVCGYSERTIKRWLKAYRQKGVDGLIPKSTAPKTHPNELPIRIKEEIISLRKKEGVCSLKLSWKLKKKGIIVPESTISKVIKRENLTRKYRKRKVKYVYVKAKRQAGELIEIDVKYVPGRIAGRRYYQYTAIDTASRWRYLAVYEEQSTTNSILFLQDVISRFPYTIQAIKTDNGSVFTNYYLGTNKRSDMSVKTIHSLDIFCRENNIVHYLIDPGKPAQNGTVERSHREDQQKFYEAHNFKTVDELRYKIRIWNNHYNNLEHCGLNGKTPLEMLRLM